MIEPLYEQLTSIRILGLTAFQWLVIVVVWLGLSLAFIVGRFVLRSQLQRLTRRTKVSLDDALVKLLERTKTWFLLAGALYSALIVADAVPGAIRSMRAIFVVLAAIQVMIWGNALIDFYVRRYRERHIEDDASAVTTMQAAGWIGRLLVFSIVVLLALDNLGVNITALIAGLGIGGIAIALAVQSVLSDIFSSLSIVIDKPFVVGDFLAVDEYLGSVDRIGLKTTRLQSLSGEQLVFSNTDLLESRIRNYKRMFERRVVFEIGVEYDTERQKLAQISEWIEEIIKAQELTRFDRAHLAKIGPYAFNYEIVYYVLDPSFNVYMDIQQAINIAIVERFDEERISLSYPTQRLHGSLLALPEQDA